MRYFKAKILWKIPIRLIPPVLLQCDRKTMNAYMPIIVFENQYDRPIFQNKIATVPLWSSVVFNERICGNMTLSSIKYLVDNAPYEFMRRGAKFELFEGGRLVATGEILD